MTLTPSQLSCKMVVMDNKCTKIDCDKERYGRQPYCRPHYRLVAKYGHNTPPLRNVGTGLTKVMRFWSRGLLTANPDKCWLWNGYIDKTTGYGKSTLTVNHSTLKYAHQVAYYLGHEKWPELWVLHSCDNRKCINPNHLREGTHRENTDDMIMRQRQATGERHGNAVLSNEQVRDIRQSSRSHKELALELGVAYSVIWTARTGHTYRNI